MKSVKAIVFLFALILGRDPAVAETLVLVAADNTVDTVISEVIVREAYRRLGFQIEICKYPGERALRLANNGEVAGDIQRIDGLSDRYGNLIQIRPAINFIEGSAFSHGQSYVINGWESLRPYRLGIIRGIKFAENNTQGMQTYLASDYSNLFTMLNSKRVDIAISPSLNGRYQAKQLGFAGIVEQRPPVARFELFHYVNKQYADLAPKLGAVFAEMERAGQLAEVRDHVITVLLDRANQGLGLCEDYSCFEDGLELSP